MAPPLGVARAGGPPGRLSRLSPRLSAARRRTAAAHPGLPAGAALRPGPPSLDRHAGGAGGCPLLPRPLRAPCARESACAGGDDRRRRGPPGPGPDRRLLLPAGPRLPALDLRGVRRAQRRAPLRLAAREPVADGRLPAAAGPGGRHQRRRRRGDRHDPRAALARHGHRRRGVRRRRERGRPARRAPPRAARGAPGALRAVRRGRGDHRLRALLAGPAPRLAQPPARPARARLRGAVAVRDPDRTPGAPAAARHPADRGDPRAGHRGRERRQAALRRRPRPGAPGGRAAGDAPRGAGDQAHLARTRALHPEPRRQGRPPLHDGQVPDDARRRRAHDRAGARGRERPARHLARPLPARRAPRRAAAALERAGRRHELRRAAARAPGVRRALSARDPGLRRAPEGPSGPHRLRAGERRVSHLCADQAQVRPRLHLQPLAVARSQDPVRDREGDADAAGHLTVAARRLADALLLLLAASVPLSTTGMEAAVLALGGLTLLGAGGGWAPVRPTPLDGVLGLFYGTLALSTLASGHPLEASGWARLWVVLTYFVVFWWLRDRRQAIRVVHVLVGAGALAAAYGLLQHETGADWYRAALGRPLLVHPRERGGAGYAIVGFFRNYLTFAHTMLFPLAWATASAMGGALAGLGAAALLLVAIAFSTARGVWLATVAVVATLVLMARGRTAGLAAGVIAAAALLAFAVSRDLRREAAHMFGLGGPNAGRVAIYAANLDIIHAHPVLGLGFGRYQRAALPFYAAHPDADRRSHAHSDYLQIAAEAGLTGLAAFALLFAAALRAGWPAIADAPDAAVRATAAGAWAGIVGFLVGGITQYNFGDNEVAIAMWTALAVLMRLREP